MDIGILRGPRAARDTYPPAAGAMPAEVDVDELVRRLDAEGWVIVPGWIDEDEVARQRAAMESVPVLRQHSPPTRPTA